MKMDKKQKNEKIYVFCMYFLLFFVEHIIIK